MSFSDRFQMVTDKFDELQRLSEKYSDYQKLPNTQIEYQDIENPEHLKKARKIAWSYNIIICVATLAFGLTTVGCFFADTGLLLKALLIGITAILLVVMCKNVFTKPKVAYGIAIYKDRTLHGHTSTVNRATRYYYYITFVPDGKKVLYTRVNISMKEYEQIQEGTRVMVVNKGPKACIL